LREERGLRDATLRLYRHHMMRFESYLTSRGIRRAKELEPALIDGFIVEMRTRHRYSPRSLHGVCSALRALLRYLFRNGRTTNDLSGVVDGPRIYQLAEIPRSIAWDDVLKTLRSVDRRGALGKRDYAILLLLAVYGLRAREVAALTLDDIQWRGEVLHVRGRKAGHATAYPLARQVGDALVDYLQHGRPVTTDRHIFFVIRAPRGPITGRNVSWLARRYLLAAGIRARRLGSHTLRHSVAQRLVDADFSLKVVGDYLGHGSPSSTRIYGKVSIGALREIALGDGEAIV
jgi:site-specific recombinase XerD